MSLNGKRLISDLARAFEDEANASHDLWTWLPSYKAAQKAHGDYASEFMPVTADVMREAAKYFSFLRREDSDNPMSKQEQEEWFKCPCDLPDCVDKLNSVS